MEEGAVYHGDAKPTKAHAQDHVVRRINAVASAFTGKKSPDGFSAEDHASGSQSRQRTGLEQLHGAHQSQQRTLHQRPQW